MPNRPPTDGRSRAKYRVPPLADRQAAARAHRHPRGPAAILVVHGMGRQVPFQTLDDIAEGLRKKDRRPANEIEPPLARSIIVGDERVSRLELNVEVDDQGTTRDVHIYEAYWAPFTEGRVTIRDVIRFLFRAGLRGLRYGAAPFRRWLFGGYWTLPAPTRTIIYLLVVLAVVMALAIVNTIVVAVSAARIPLVTPPRWLQPALFADLTTILNLLMAVFLPFGAAIFLAMSPIWRWVRQLSRLAALPLFIAAIWSTILAAVAATIIVVHDLYTAQQHDVAPLVSDYVWSDPLNRIISMTLLVTVVIIAVAAAARWIWRFVTRPWRAPRDASSGHRGRTLFVVAVAVGIFLSAAVLAFGLSDRAWPAGDIVPFVRSGLAWPCVIAVSAYVRWYLIEFVGDVVAYVDAQTLDKFYELRRQIKDCVWRRALMVYQMQEYQDILLVGHSLGSVVTYDVLNRLLLEEVNGPRYLPVKSRTRLLLTFGSPLDKTAFLFAAQGTGSEAREALAASLQPLITDENVRPPWINVFSPFDIISGSLEYYDLPPHRTNRNHVENISDPDARTLLTAHVEYWKGSTIFDVMKAHLH